MASWVLVDNGQPIGNLIKGQLSDASASASGAQVVVLAPGEDVLLTEVFLPGQNRQKIRKAVPYAVEDQLIDDVEEMHFALGARSGEGRYGVAIVEQTRMQAWADSLQQAGVQADFMVPDSLMMPATEETWSVLIEPDRVLVGMGLARGFVVDQENLAVLLEAAITDAGEESPHAIDVFTSSGQEAALPDLTEVTANIEIHNKTYDQDTLVWLAQNFDPRRVINLLQGEYSRKEKLGKLFKPWYPAAAMLVAWLAFQGGLDIYRYISLANQSEALQQQITSIYRKAFPQAKKVVNAKVQMQQQLKKLRKSSGQAQGSLQEMLATAGPILMKAPGLKLQTLRYHDGRMDLEFEIKDMDALGDLEQRLSQQAGWEVDIQSASSRDNKVESRMQIRNVGT